MRQRLLSFAVFSIVLLFSNSANAASFTYDNDFSDGGIGPEFQQYQDGDMILEWSTGLVNLGSTGPGWGEAGVNLAAYTFDLTQPFEMSASLNNSTDANSTNTGIYLDVSDLDDVNYIGAGLFFAGGALTYEFIHEMGDTVIGLVSTSAPSSSSTMYIYGDGTGSVYLSEVGFDVDPTAVFSTSEWGDQRGLLNIGGDKEAGAIINSMSFDDIHLQGTTAVPEPASLLLLGSGLVGMLGLRKVRR